MNAPESCWNNAYRTVGANGFSASSTKIVTSGR